MINIWDPIPSFQRINYGFCSDCDSELSDSGYCPVCHIVPSLDPEFQQWLQNPPTIPTLIATNLDFNDLCHWHRRAKDLLGQSVVIVAPIVFNRHDWTGKVGIIRPVSANTFTVDGIEGFWTLNNHKGIAKISDGEREYRGFWHYGKAYFSECGCEREDADPRIAFAQVMYNI